MLKLAGAALAALLFSTPALAGEMIAGVYRHGIVWGIGASGQERDWDAELGLRSDPLGSLPILGKPSLYILGHANLDGHTSFGAAGLSWRRNWGGQRHRFYAQGGIGIAYQDGLVDFPDATVPGLTPAQVSRRLYDQSHRIALGSRLLFEPEVDLGYRLNDRWAMEAAYVHISNASLGSRNPGLDSVGLRLVRRFGRG